MPFCKIRKGIHDIVRTIVTLTSDHNMEGPSNREGIDEGQRPWRLEKIRAAVRSTRTVARKPASMEKARKTRICPKLIRFTEAVIL